MSLHLYLEIMRSLGIKEPDPPAGLGRVFEGLPSWFDVSGLAEASIAAAAVQVANAISREYPRMQQGVLRFRECKGPMGAEQKRLPFCMGCGDTGIGHCVKSFMQTESVYWKNDND